jgi:hypothetical protein
MVASMPNNVPPRSTKRYKARRTRLGVITCQENAAETRYGNSAGEAMMISVVARIIRPGLIRYTYASIEKNPATKLATRVTRRLKMALSILTLRLSSFFTCLAPNLLHLRGKVPRDNQASWPAPAIVGQRRHSQMSSEHTPNEEPDPCGNQPDNPKRSHLKGPQVPLPAPQ